MPKSTRFKIIQESDDYRLVCSTLDPEQVVLQANMVWPSPPDRRWRLMSKHPCTAKRKVKSRVHFVVVRDRQSE